MSKLKIGLAKAVLTPPAKSCAQVGTVYYRPTKFVESDLYANVAVIEGEEDVMILCACDLLKINDKFKAGILKRVNELDPSVNTEKISVSATHTHNGPAVAPTVNPFFKLAEALPEGYTYEDDTPYDPEVWLGDKTVPYLTEKIAGAIVQAWQNRKEGYFSPGFGRCDIGHTRRVQYRDGKVINYGITNSVNFDTMQGVHDAGVELLFFFDENKKPTGAIANVACPAQVLEQVHTISADFWGKCRDFLEEDFGKEFVLLGLCGAAGDQTPKDLIRLERAQSLVQPAIPPVPRRSDPEVYSIESCVDVGERLAIEIKRVFRKAKDGLKDSGAVKHKKFVLTLPGLTISNDTYADARKAVTEYVKTLENKVLSSAEIEKIQIPLAQINRYKEQEENRMVYSEIQVMRFDDMAFATCPYELFIDYGNRIKTRSRATQTFIAQLANGSHGYLPTKIGYETGGYGVDRSCFVEQAAGEIITEAIIAEIAKMME